MNYLYRYILTIVLLSASLFAQSPKQDIQENDEIFKTHEYTINNIQKSLAYYLFSYQSELLINDMTNLLNKTKIDSISIKDEEINEYHNFIKIKNKVFYNQSNSIINGKNNLHELKKDLFHENQKVGSLHIFIAKGQKEDKIALTKKEKQWIKENPVVKLAIMSYWPNNKDGTNYHKKVIKLINANVGTNIIPVTFDVWSQGYKKASQGEDINGIMGLSYSKQREKEHFIYSPVYHFTPAYLITRKNDIKITSITDIKDKTVYLKKDSITHKYIKRAHPSTKIIDKYTTGEMYLNLNKQKEADAILSYFVDKKEVAKNSLKIVDRVYDKEGEVSIGINKKYPELASIINKALNHIPKDHLNSLMDEDGLKLTNKEKKWLGKKIKIDYVYDPNWKPFEWANELNEHKGIIADLIKLIEHKSDLKFNPVYTKTWNGAIKKVKSGNAVMYSAVGETSERKRYMNFTKHNLYSIPFVFVSKKGTDYVNGFDDLKHKKVTVAGNYVIHNLLKKIRPDINPHLVANNQLALEKVSSGEVDVALLNAATAKYYINILGFDNLKISYKTKYNLDLKIAIRKDFDKEAVSIIDKTIKNITKKEFDDILYKWTEVVVRDKTNWMFIAQIVLVISILILMMYLNNRKLKSLVIEKTKDIQKQHMNIQEQKEELENLLNSFDKNVIFTKTDKEGVITHASDAFCEISGFERGELIGKPHSIVRHPDMPKELFEDLWRKLEKGESLTQEIKNQRKDGSFYWVEGRFEPEYDKNGNLVGYSAIRQDITSKKEVEQFTTTLENRVKERTNQLDKAKKQIETILENILLPVLITSKKSRKIVYANRYAEIQYETKLEDMIGSSIDNLYTVNDQNHEIIKQMQEKGSVENLEQKFKTHAGTEFTALLCVTPITYNEEDAYIGMVTDITKQKEIEKEIREIHKQTRDSIEYASIIQHSLIPQKEIFDKYFKDQFCIWEPKDIVGGDIYLVEMLSDNEVIIMVIDCTGHGVPGAFVTMLVKAIERQVIAIINNNEFIEISPAWILSYFNQTIKTLLNQTDLNGKSNAGFDGGVLYYNKKEQIIKFAGSYTPLFYIDESGEMKSIKGDRHSIGYKKSDINYIFNEETLNVKEGMKFYLSTDGYFDQNGGEKGFPFGKKRFENIIKENKNKPFREQREIVLDELKRYQKGEERNDDITIVGIEI